MPVITPWFAWLRVTPAACAVRAARVRAETVLPRIALVSAGPAGPVPEENPLARAMPATAAVLTSVMAIDLRCMGPPFLPFPVVVSDALGRVPGCTSRADFSAERRCVLLFRGPHVVLAQA
jgi:hypothetical protein